jgi:hypothetical protein
MAEQDVQIGAGTVQGISGAITMTPGTGTALADGGANYSSIGQTTNFTLDELANSGGTYFESAIFSKQFKDTRVDFLPKGTTRANAESVIDAVDGWAMGAVITIASATATTLNVVGNLISGIEKSFTREGRVSISFTIRSYQKADGTFGGLASVTG